MKGRAPLAPVLLAAALSSSALARPPAAHHGAGLGRVGIARVIVEARRDRVRTTTVLTLPALPRAARRLLLFASYGAPGPPLALDAGSRPRRPAICVPPTACARRPAARAVRPAAPADAAVILGTRRMAGSVIEIGRAPLAALSLLPVRRRCASRSVRAMPPPAADGSRELLVRLGTRGRPPARARQRQVRGAHVTKKSARLCDRKGADLPLAVLPVTGHDASAHSAAPRRAHAPRCALRPAVARLERLRRRGRQAARLEVVGEADHDCRGLRPRRRYGAPRPPPRRSCRCSRYPR